MNQNNLFASAALFGELFNKEKDIYDVISEFVLSVLKSEKKWSFTSNEATAFLKNVFDFEIPESVVKSAINTKLKKTGIVVAERGQYYVNIQNIDEDNKIIIELENNKGIHASIIDNLALYISTTEERAIPDSEKAVLYDNFNSFLTGNGINDKYSKSISAFIIAHQDDITFKNKLNVIKEGLILYNGIRFTADLANLGHWDTDLTIFLDTEHLFNAGGFNGTIYQEIFNDFYKLTNEINNRSIRKGEKGKITLKYFDESADKIEAFFQVAEGKVRNKGPIDPSKEAMRNIINGCESASDVVDKKTTFYTALKTMGISPESRYDYYRHDKYIIDDQPRIDALAKLASENGRPLDEDDCRYVLKLFTKINVLRKGDSKGGFENIRHVLLTGKGSAYYYAQNEFVKPDAKDFTFATDIDYIINKFWFKLKKGFNDKDALPKSFDVVTRAQIILSTQISKSISIQYEELVRRNKAGTLSVNDAIALNYNFRNILYSPEDITLATLDDSLNFINEDAFEKLENEKAAMLREIGEGAKAISELRMYRALEWVKKKKTPKRIANAKYYFEYGISVALITAFAGLTFYIFYRICKNLSSVKDSIPDLIGLVALVFSDIFTLVKRRKILSWLRVRKFAHYRKLLKTI